MAEQAPPAGGERVPHRLQSGAETLARYCAIALGFTLPISVAADNVLMGLLLLSWLASGHWSERWQRIRANRVALAALVLFAVMALGLTWSQAPMSQALVYFRKYDDLLLLAILVTVVLDARDRRRALLALAAAVAVTVVLSIGIKLGLVPTGGFITGTADNPTVFKKYLSQNIVVAFGCFLFAVLALDAPNRAWRTVWWTLAALAAFNVLFMVQGRTGYVVLPVLALWLLHGVSRWRGLLLAVLAVGVVLGGAYQFSPAFRTRVTMALGEWNSWQSSGRGTGGVGERLEFYDNTVKIIRSHPWFGVGTGDFERAYSEQVAGTDMPVTRNPHNQYLLTAAQTGVLGLAAMLVLFATQWRLARRLPTRSERLLAGGLVLTIMVGSLFNSLLIDHTESLLFSWGAGVLFAGLGSRETERDG
jgi:O-antigen ligase